MARSVNRTTIVVLATALCAIIRADTPANPFAAQIQAYKDHAALVREELGVLGNTAAQMPGYTEGDMILITSSMNNLADILVKTGAAFEKGDEASAAALAKPAEELYANRYRWSQRLEYRKRQAQLGEYQPANEDTFDGYAGDDQPEDVKPLAALMEVKKRRSEVNGRLADATTPTADPELLFKLQDEAFAAEVEAQVVNLKWGCAIEDRDTRKWLMADLSVSSPEMTAARERLAASRQQREETLRQIRKLEHASEQQVRQYPAFVDVWKKAYIDAKAVKDAVDAKAAKEARDRAKPNN